MTREEYELHKAVKQREEFMEAIAPLLRVKANIYSVSMPKVTIYPDGRIETEHPQWVQEACAKLDEMIETT